MTAFISAVIVWGFWVGLPILGLLYLWVKCDTQNNRPYDWERDS